MPFDDWPSKFVSASRGGNNAIPELSWIFGDDHRSLSGCVADTKLKFYDVVDGNFNLLSAVSQDFKFLK
jgi:hypothetical protein